MKKPITLLALFMSLMINAQWEKKYFVDEFKEPTEKEYIINNAVGNFSNIATINSDLIVATHVYKEDKKLLFVFKFYEYGNNVAYFSAFYGDLKLRKEGKDYEYRVSVGSGTIKVFGKKNIESIINLFSEGGEIKGVYVHSYHSSPSTYNFTINSDGFKDAFDSL